MQLPCGTDKTQFQRIYHGSSWVSSSFILNSCVHFDQLCFPVMVSSLMRVNSHTYLWVEILGIALV